MNKRLSLLLTSTLLLCGCSDGQLFGSTKPDYDNAYTTTAQIRYGDYSAVCDISRNGADDWSFSFTQPDYLMGMELSLNDDGLTASLGELSVTAESKGAYQLIPDIIAQAVDSLSAIAAENITDNEGILTLNTEIDGKKVIITSDKSGQLLTLKCPYHKLSVEFSQQLAISSPNELDTLETEEVSIIFDE